MLGFVNETGAHVGGLGGFLRSLGTLIGRMDPTSVYIVFDGVGSTVNRKNLIPEYKADRHLTRITTLLVTLFLGIQQPIQIAC